MHISRKTFGYGILILVLAAVVGLVFWLTSGSAWATAQVGNAEKYTFYLADSALERAKGLAGTKLGDMKADGMLFAFPDDAKRTFTMKGMLFNLDILWIRDGRIVDIDYAVQAPKSGSEEPVKVASDPLLVDMVIEVPAGQAQAMNFQVGHNLTIDLDAAAGN